MTPEQRTLRARIAAYTMHSRNDGLSITAAARSAFAASFETTVDPDGVLPLPERQRCAEALRKAHYARLALKSSIKRAA